MYDLTPYGGTDEVQLSVTVLVMMHCSWGQLRVV